MPRIWNVKPTQFAPRCTTCTDYWWLWDFSLAGFVPGGDPNQVIRPGDFQVRTLGVCVRLASTERATARVMQEGSAGRKIRHQPRPD